MRKTLRTLTVFGVTAVLLVAFTMPASAFIHELVASFCAADHHVPSPTGNIHNPPGLTSDALDGVSAADNIAQPLFASGAYDVTEITASEKFLVPDTSTPDPFDITEASGPATLIELNDDRPQVKFEGLEIRGEPVFFPLGGDTFLQIPEPDHVAFEKCANLN